MSTLDDPTHVTEETPKPGEPGGSPIPLSTPDEDSPIQPPGGSPEAPLPAEANEPRRWELAGGDEPGEPEPAEEPAPAEEEEEPADEPEEEPEEAS